MSPLLSIRVLHSNLYRLYYKRDPTRLSACPFTIHALLHIAWGIREASPFWTYWTYPMEQHCINQSEADATHMHLLVRLSLQLHSSIKSDYYMIYTKHYVWIPMKRKAPNLYMIYVGSDIHFLLVSCKIQTDPDYMLAAPRQCEMLPHAIQNKILACLAMCFEVQRSIIQSVIKLDQPIVQYGRVSRLKGGDHMIGHHFFKQAAKDSRDASFVRFLSSFHMCNF